MTRSPAPDMIIKSDMEMVMRWTVTVTETRVTEVEADTREQAQDMGRALSTFRQVAVSSTTVSARWAGANDEMYRLVGLWSDAGEPDADVEGQELVHDDVSRAAAVVREWAVGQGEWPMEPERAESVYDELLDHMQDVMGD